MSVNGQDPRSNVYLLDGTLLNDMTNGPAGSAAGTALGMETVQEFRVETNAYSAEFGRMSGGQINVLTKAGQQRRARQRLRVPSQRRARREELLRRRRQAAVHAQPVRRRGRAGRSGATGCSTSSATRRCSENLGRTITSTRARRQRAPRADAGSGEPGRAAQRRRQSRRRAVSGRVSARRTAQSSATARRSTAFSSIRRSTSTSCRDASTTTSAPAASSSRATRSTTPSSFCRPTIRSSRGTSCRAISSSPASTARC